VSDVLHDLFTNQRIRKLFYRTRYLLALLLVVPLARYMHPELLPFAIGLSLFGQAIQGWCFASLIKNRELSIRGPYLLVRNPMYLGRYFLILGFVLLLGSPVAIVVHTVLYYLYMLYRVKREERRLNRAYTEEFRRYCSRVRRFWPRWGKLLDPGVRFWDNAMFLENNGHWNILLTLVAYVAVTTLHVAAFA
jgi:steroid 5-alpha reductase family enzyme